VGVAVVAAAAAWTWPQYVWTSTVRAGAVPVLAFSADGDVRDSVLRARMPAKLTGALTGAVRLTPAACRDDDDRLSRVVLRHVQTLAPTTLADAVTYDASAVLARASYLPAARPADAPDAVVTTGDFWRRVPGGAEGSASSSLLYYEDAATRAFADVAHDIPGMLVQRGEVAPSVIMAAAGAVRRAQLHAGVVFLTQLVGNSTVTLWSPAELPRTHLYPSYHPNHGQSQARIGVHGWPWRAPDAWPQLWLMAHRTPIHAHQVRPWAHAAPLQRRTDARTPAIGRAGRVRHSLHPAVLVRRCHRERERERERVCA
jgi:hypothetical protein